jgi:GT2 family glycosyltransferase
MHARTGVVAAVNMAYKVAKGEHLFLFNDESTLDPECLARLMRQSLLRPEAIVTVHHEPVFPFVYYGLPFAPFPFARRKVFDDLGGLLDPVYRGFYADPDLSLRAHAKHVPIVTVEDAVLRHCNEHDAPHAQSVSRYLEQDRATFRARWDHLGVFCDP